MWALGAPTNPYLMYTPPAPIGPYATPNSNPPTTPRVDPRSLTGRIYTFGTVGQSNGGNMMPGYAYVPVNTGKVLVLDVYTGLLHQYMEPITGGSGIGGNWMGEAADAMINAGAANYVVITNAAAIGSTSVETFVPGANGWFVHRIQTIAQRVSEIGLTMSAWNFALGESAMGYSETQFRTQLDAMIANTRANISAAPWIMDITTYYTDPNVPHADLTNPGAVAALQNIVNEANQIYAGVNSDDLTFATGHRQSEPQTGGWNAHVHLNTAGCHAKAARKGTNLIALKDKLAWTQR
jgi:hypothetical protein